MKGKSIGDMTDAELAQWGVSRKPEAPKVLSGRINAGVVGATPGNPLSVFGTSFDRAQPRVLQLGQPVSSYNAADASSRFPPLDPGSFSAGLRGDATWNAAVIGNRFAAAVLTYGAGASSRRVFFDWRPGSYNLPPCEAVTLEVIPYGTGWAAFAGFGFAASLAPGHLLDAHVPTVTGAAALGAGMINQDAVIGIPPAARVFDVYSLDGFGAVIATPDDGQGAVHDYVNGVHFPGGGYVECESGNVAIHAVGVEYEAVRVGVKFFIAL